MGGGQGSDPSRVLKAVGRLNELLEAEEARSVHRAARLARLWFAADRHLVVYGSLVPGGRHHDLVSDLEGTWSAGWVRGWVDALGWGRTGGYPALRWELDGPTVAAWLLDSADLRARWAELDAFEGPAYRRVLVPFEDAGGIRAVAYAYVLSEEGGSPPATAC